MLAKRLCSINSKTTGVIPDYVSPNGAELSSLNDFIKKSKNLLVITGAGVSTESGIRGLFLLHLHACYLYFSTLF